MSHPLLITINKMAQDFVEFIARAPIHIVRTRQKISERTSSPNFDKCLKN
jgi:hypothetical protein